MPDTAVAPIDWSVELDRNRPWMLKVLRSRVGDAHVADDLIQDVAVAVLRQPSRPTDTSKIAPWLYRLTVRQSINFHRRRKRHLNSTNELVMDDSTVGDDARPLDWLIREESVKSVRMALGQLRPADREMLTLKYAENWTYQQIADHLGAKVKTIEYRLMKAKRKLRRLLVQDF